MEYVSATTASLVLLARTNLVRVAVNMEIVWKMKENLNANVMNLGLVIGAMCPSFTKRMLCVVKTIAIIMEFVIPILAFAKHFLKELIAEQNGILFPDGCSILYYIWW